MTCRIVEVNPPRRLVMAWQGSGDVAFDLQPRGDAVMLTVIHARLPDRKTLLKVGAGWHMHLDLLAACATGGRRQPFWGGAGAACSRNTTAAGRLEHAKGRLP